MKSRLGRDPHLIANVFSRMDPGGAELRMIELVAAVNAGCDFIATSGRPGTLDASLRERGYDVHNLRMAITHFPAFMKLMRRKKYAVVHSHLGPASGPVMLLARLTGVPKRIVHFHSDAVGGRSTLAKSVYLTLSRWLIAALATDIVGVSPGTLTYGWSKKWPGDSRCRVVPNGFDAAQLRDRAGSERRNNVPFRTTGDRIIVVNVGRPDPVKNRSRALAIWERLAQGTDSKLVFVGALNASDDQAITEALERQSERYEIVKVGDTLAVPEYIGEADVLLVTSTREGLPSVVLEALAIGTPVVASRLPGTEWIKSHCVGLELCSLTSDDGEWVQAIHHVVGLDRDRISAAFESSPFIIEHAITSFRKLWGLDSAPSEIEGRNSGTDGSH
jgi:glycosyltransferase involved in cell wall biosynthesis